MSYNKKIKLSNHSHQTELSENAPVVDLSTAPFFHKERAQYLARATFETTLINDSAFIFENTNDFVEAFSTRNLELLLIRLRSFKTFLSQILKHHEKAGRDAEYERMIRIFSDWDERSDHFAALFDILQTQDPKESPKMLKAILLAFNKLLNVLNDDLFSLSGTIVIKKLLAKNQELIATSLSSPSSPEFLPILKIVISIAQFQNPIISNELIKLIQAFPKIVKKLASLKDSSADPDTSRNSKKTSTADIRSLWVSLVLLLLESANLNNKEYMLDRFGLISSLFNFLPYSSYNEAASILSNIHNYIYSDQRIKRKFKVDFICSNAFDQLLKLLNYTDAIDADQIRDANSAIKPSFSSYSKNLIILPTNNSTDSIADLAQRFMIDIICRKGFIFSSEKQTSIFDFQQLTNKYPHYQTETLDDSQTHQLPTSALGASSITPKHKFYSQNNNTDSFKIFRLLTTKIKHTQSKKHYDLSLKILQTYPELIASFWRKAKFSTEPRLSLVFLSNISFILNVMSIEIPFFKTPTNSSSIHEQESTLGFAEIPSVGTVAEFIVPCQFNRLLLSKGTQHTSSSLVKYMILLVIGKAMQNLSLLRDRINSTILLAHSYMNKAKSSSRYHDKHKEIIASLLQLESKVLQTVKRRLPEWSVILSIYRSTHSSLKGGKSKAGATTSESHPNNTVTPSISFNKTSKPSELFLEVVLRVVSGYNKHYPEWILESRFDLLKLLDFKSSDIYGPNSVFTNVLSSAQFSSSNFFKLLQLQHIIDCMNYTNKNQVSWTATSSSIFVPGSESESESESEPPPLSLSHSFPKTNFGTLVAILLSQKPTTNSFAKSLLIKCIVDSEVLNQTESPYSSNQYAKNKDFTAKRVSTAIVDSLYVSCNLGDNSNSSVDRICQFASFFEKVYSSIYKDKYRYLDLTSKWTMSGFDHSTQTQPQANVAETGLFLTIFIEKWISEYADLLKNNNDFSSSNYSKKILQCFASTQTFENFLADNKTPDLLVLFWLRDLVVRLIGVYGSSSVSFFSKYLTSYFKISLDDARNRTERLDPKEADLILSAKAVNANISPNLAQQYTFIQKIFNRVMKPVSDGLSNCLADSNYDYTSYQDLDSKNPSKTDLDAIKLLAKNFYNFKSIPGSSRKAASLNDCTAYLSSLALRISHSSLEIINEELLKLYQLDQQPTKSAKVDRIAIWYLFCCRLDTRSSEVLSTLYPNMDQQITTFSYFFAESILTQLFFSKPGDLPTINFQQQSLVSRYISESTGSNWHLSGLLNLVFSRLQRISSLDLPENPLSLKTRVIIFDFIFDFSINKLHSKPQPIWPSSSNNFELSLDYKAGSQLSDFSLDSIFLNLDFSESLSVSAAYQNYCLVLFLHRIATKNGKTISKCDLALKSMIDTTINKLNGASDTTVNEGNLAHLVSLLSLTVPLIDTCFSENILNQIQMSLDPNHCLENKEVFGMKLALLSGALKSLTKMHHNLRIENYFKLLDTISDIWILDVPQFLEQNKPGLGLNDNSFSDKTSPGSLILPRLSEFLVSLISMLYAPESVYLVDSISKVSDRNISSQLHWPSETTEVVIFDSTVASMSQLVSEKLVSGKFDTVRKSGKSPETLINCKSHIQKNSLDKLIPMLPAIISSAFAQNQTFMTRGVALNFLKLLIVVNPSVRGALCTELGFSQTLHKPTGYTDLFEEKNKMEISTLAASYFLETVCSRFADGAIRFNSLLYRDVFSRCLLENKATNRSNAMIHSNPYNFSPELTFALNLGEKLNQMVISKQLLAGKVFSDGSTSVLASSKNYIIQLAVVYETWVQTKASSNELLAILNTIETDIIVSQLHNGTFFIGSNDYEVRLCSLLSLLSSSVFGFIRVLPLADADSNIPFRVASILTTIATCIYQAGDFISKGFKSMVELAVLLTLRNCNKLLAVIKPKQESGPKNSFFGLAVSDYCQLVSDKITSNPLELDNDDHALPLGNDFKISMLLLLLLGKFLDIQTLTNDSVGSENISSNFSNMLLTFINHPHFLVAAHRVNRNLVVSFVSILWVVVSKLSSSKQHSLLPSKLIHIVASCYNGSISSADDVLIQLMNAYEGLTDISIEDAMMSFGYKSSLKLAKEQLSNYHYGYDLILQSKREYVLNELTSDSVNFCLANLDAKKVNKTLHSFFSSSLEVPANTMNHESSNLYTSSSKTFKDLFLSTENLMLNSIESSDLLLHSQSLKTKPDIYNPRFLLRIFSSALSIENGADLKLLIKKNCLGLAFAAISSPQTLDRAMGYMILARILALINSGSRCEGRNQIKLILVNLQNSIDEKNKRIPYVISLFLANSALIITRPDHRLYAFINKTILQSPKFKLSSVPSFIGAIFPDNESPNSMRSFLFKIASFGSASYFADRVLFQKFFVYEQMFSFDTTPMVSSNLYDSSDTMITLFNLSMKQNSLSLYHAMSARDGLLATWIRQRIGLVLQNGLGGIYNNKKNFSSILLSLGSILSLSRLILRILANSPTFLLKKADSGDYGDTNNPDCLDFYPYWIGSSSNEYQSFAGSNFILDTANSILNFLHEVLSFSERENSKLTLDVLTLISAVSDTILATTFMYTEMQILKKNFTGSTQKLNSSIISQLDTVAISAEGILRILEKATVLPPKLFFESGFENFAKDEVVTSGNFEILTRTGNLYPHSPNILYSETAGLEHVLTNSFYFSSSSVTLFKLVLLTAGCKRSGRSSSYNSKLVHGFKQSLSRVLVINPACLDSYL